MCCTEVHRRVGEGRNGGHYKHTRKNGRRKRQAKSIGFSSSLIPHYSSIYRLQDELGPGSRLDRSPSFSLSHQSPLIARTSPSISSTRAQKPAQSRCESVGSSREQIRIMASSNRHWPSMYRSSLACNIQQPQPDMNNGKSSLMSSSKPSLVDNCLHVTVSCCMLIISC